MRTENLCQTGVWKGSDSEQQPKKTSRTRNSAAQQEHKTHGASQTCTSGGGRRPPRAEFLEKVIKLGTQKSRLNFHAGTRKTVFFSRFSRNHFVSFSFGPFSHSREVGERSHTNARSAFLLLRASQSSSCVWKILPSPC